MVLAAIGNCYYSPTANTTSAILRTQGMNTEILLAPLINKVLWNKTFTMNDSLFTSLLDLPMTNGSYNYGNCNNAGFEWSAPVRWRQLERRGAGCISEQQDLNCFDFFPGEYNSLDYMLLFNLYRLSNPAYMDGSFPTLARPLGRQERSESRARRQAASSFHRQSTRFARLETGLEFSRDH